MSTVICRVCLTTATFRMHKIEDTQLLDIYEKLTGAKFDYDDRLPNSICGICAWLLNKCQKLSNMACKSQKILYELLEETGEEITNSTSLHNFNVKSIFSLSFSVVKITSADDGDSFVENQEPTVIKEEKIDVKIEPGDSDEDLDKTDNVEIEISPQPDKKSKKVKETTSTASYKCKFCSMKFTSEIRHSMHFRKHLAKKHKSCKNCTYTTRLDKRVEKLSSRHFCEVCDKCFTAKKSLEAHMTSHTKERPFICEVCGQSFRYKGNLVRHKKYIHKNQENPKAFACKICDKTFKFEPFLTRHQKVHEDKGKRFICDICDFKFGYKNNLQKHMRIHTGERPFSCDYCGKTFAANGSLTIHLRIHTRMTPYQCSECHVTFTQKAHLTTHIKIIHKGEKPFTCERCQKTFTMKSNLKKHMDRHAAKDILHLST